MHVTEPELSGLRAHDDLELKLRRLAGVTLVAFGDRQGTTVVELSVDANADRELIRTEATRIALASLSGPLLVELAGSLHAAADEWPVGDASVESVVPGPAGSGVGSHVRVRLLAVVPDAEPGRVRIVLAHRGKQVAARATLGDLATVVTATLAALADLGLPAPFAVDGIVALGADAGGGTIVLLREPRSGQVRRGIAGGRLAEEAAARATLNALNRYLQASG